MNELNKIIFNKKFLELLRFDQGEELLKAYLIKSVNWNQTKDHRQSIRFPKKAKEQIIHLLDFVYAQTGLDISFSEFVLRSCQNQLNLIQSELSSCGFEENL